MKEEREKSESSFKKEMEFAPDNEDIGEQAEEAVGKPVEKGKKPKMANIKTQHHLRNLKLIHGLDEKAVDEDLLWELEDLNKLTNQSFSFPKQKAKDAKEAQAKDKKEEDKRKTEIKNKLDKRLASVMAKMKEEKHKHYKEHENLLSSFLEEKDTQSDTPPSISSLKQSEKSQENKLQSSHTNITFTDNENSKNSENSENSEKEYSQYSSDFSMKKKKLQGLESKQRELDMVEEFAQDEESFPGFEDYFNRKESGADVLSGRTKGSAQKEGFEEGSQENGYDKLEKEELMARLYADKLTGQQFQDHFHLEKAQFKKDPQARVMMYSFF